MSRLTKRNKDGVAYLKVADTLPKSMQEIESSKPVLEAIFAVFQKLAYYEDKYELSKDESEKPATEFNWFET